MWPSTARAWCGSLRTVTRRRHDVAIGRARQAMPRHALRGHRRHADGAWAAEFSSTATRCACTRAADRRARLFGRGAHRHDRYAPRLVRNVELPLESALAMVTSAPARAAGLDTVGPSGRGGPRKHPAARSRAVTGHLPHHRRPCCAPRSDVVIFHKMKKCYICTSRAGKVRRHASLATLLIGSLLSLHMGGAQAAPLSITVNARGVYSVSETAETHPAIVSTVAAEVDGRWSVRRTIRAVASSARRPRGI